jgi:hypothetical protein
LSFCVLVFACVFDCFAFVFVSVFVFVVFRLLLVFGPWQVTGPNARNAAATLARYLLLKQQQLAIAASSPPACKDERKNLAETL